MHRDSFHIKRTGADTVSSALSLSEQINSILPSSNIVQVPFLQLKQSSQSQQQHHTPKSIAAEMSKGLANLLSLKNALTEGTSASRNPLNRSTSRSHINDSSSSELKTFLPRDGLMNSTSSTSFKGSSKLNSSNLGNLSEALEIQSKLHKTPSMKTLEQPSQFPQVSIDEPFDQGQSQNSQLSYAIEQSKLALSLLGGRSTNSPKSANRRSSLNKLTPSYLKGSDQYAGIENQRSSRYSSPAKNNSTSNYSLTNHTSFSKGASSHAVQRRNMFAENEQQQASRQKREYSPFESYENSVNMVSAIELSQKSMQQRTSTSPMMSYRNRETDTFGVSFENNNKLLSENLSQNIIESQDLSKKTNQIALQRQREKDSHRLQFLNQCKGRPMKHIDVEAKENNFFEKRRKSIEKRFEQLSLEDTVEEKGIRKTKREIELELLVESLMVELRMVKKEIVYLENKSQFFTFKDECKGCENMSKEGKVKGIKQIDEEIKRNEIEQVKQENQELHLRIQMIEAEYKSILNENIMLVQKLEQHSFDVIGQQKQEDHHYQEREELLEKIARLESERVQEQEHVNHEIKRIKEEEAYLYYEMESKMKSIIERKDDSIQKLNQVIQELLSNRPK